MNQLFDSTMFFGGNAPFVEELYENYLNNPTRSMPSGAIISTDWRRCLALSLATLPTPRLLPPLPNWQRMAVSAVRTGVVGN
jgi:hypothetical protein